MRSRFAAYALDLPEYIIKTTHPASPQYSDDKFSWKRKISRFSRASNFEKLEILDFKEQGTLATVTFTAYIKQEGEDVTFTETSYFEKFRERWLYRAGLLADGRSPHLIPQGPLKILPLTYYGDPLLTKKATPVVSITDSIKELVEKMKATMDASDGIGLAAPQVHHSIRLFITRTPIELENGEYDWGEVKTFINPVIVERSTDTNVDREGCLSIPGITAHVERSLEITVEYNDLEGKICNQRFTGYEARIIQHENDHIDGILLSAYLDEAGRSKLERLQKRLNSP
jgi:peptide deformylase